MVSSLPLYLGDFVLIHSSVDRLYVCLTYCIYCCICIVMLSSLVEGESSTPIMGRRCTTLMSDSDMMMVMMMIIKVLDGDSKTYYYYDLLL